MGEVTVQIPHSNNGNAAVDSGQDFDATEEFLGADLDASGMVDGADLLMALSHWSESAWSDGDANLSGMVNGADLTLILSNWGLSTKVGG